MKSYLFSYDLSGLNFDQRHLEAFIASNKYIQSWSYIFPGSYFIKSNSNFEDVWRSIHSFLDGNLFVIAEIKEGPERTNGTINTNVWNWLNSRAQNALTAVIADLEKRK